jgi:hypothetical protein
MSRVKDIDFLKNKIKAHTRNQETLVKSFNDGSERDKVIIKSLLVEAGVWDRINEIESEREGQKALVKEKIESIKLEVEKINLIIDFLKERQLEDDSEADLNVPPSLELNMLGDNRSNKKL